MDFRCFCRLRRFHRFSAFVRMRGVGWRHASGIEEGADRAHASGIRAVVRGDSRSEMRVELQFSFRTAGGYGVERADHRQAREHGHAGTVRRISRSGGACRRESRARRGHHPHHRLLPYEARNIIGLSHELCVRFGGEVPADMASLVSLPGVGRKTANVVLGNAFGVPGFPVDTHVIRVTGRLRWRSDWASPSPDPVAIEREVTACFPPEEWTDLSHRLILHGRAICHARKPDCADCPLNDTCPSAFAA